MNRDVAGLEEEDDDDEKEKRALRWRGWREGEEDVRGSICQPLSRVPAGFYLRQLPACFLLNILPSAWTDPKYKLVWPHASSPSSVHTNN